MKTSTRLTFTVLFTLTVSVVVNGFARAETDQEFEISMRQRQRDFNAFIKERNSKRSDNIKAAEALHAARNKAEALLAENQRNYQKVMKRYSMEEVEARDREDDERLMKERTHDDTTRTRFIEARARRRSIEASVGLIDPYAEFEINMNVEPETKVSHPGSSMSSSPAGVDAL